MRWTTADKELNSAYLVAMRKWQRDEKIACAQLAQVVSDSLLICIQHAKGVADMWESIIAEYDKKGCMIQVDLRRKMMEKRASDADDIRAHLDEMALMHECLNRMGVILHNDDYSSMILMSLPESYTMHLETLADVASSSGNPLTAHAFIMKAIDLYEKCQLHSGHDIKLGNKDTTFQTHDPKNKGKRAGRKPKKDVKCFNCHKKGHFSHDCYRPGSNKERQGPRSNKGGHKPKEGSANTTNDAPDGAWCAITSTANYQVHTFPDDNDIYLEEVDELDGPDTPPTLVESGLEPTHVDAAHVAQPEPPIYSPPQSYTTLGPPVT